MFQQNYNPKTAILVTRYGCPYTCSNCIYNSDPSRLEKMDSRTVEKIIPWLSEKGFDSVIFSGGEPFLNRDIFSWIELASSLNLKAKLQSSYLGSFEKIEGNVNRLKNSGLEELITSVDMYHNQGKPKKMDDYIEYMKKIFIETMKKGISICCKNTWDFNQGEDSRTYINNFSSQFLSLLKKNKIVLIPNLFERRTYFFHMEDGINSFQSEDLPTLTTYDGNTIKIGRARSDSKISSEEDLPLSDYTPSCPIVRDNNIYGEGILTINPNLSVARCCSYEDNVSFSEQRIDPQNVYESLDRLFESINSFDSPWTNHDFLLELKQKGIRTGILDPNKIYSSCEICSTMMKDKDNIPIRFIQ